MSYPCRPSTCDHLQCFDANLFLMMNERKPKWLCPVCNKPAQFKNLLIDGFFNEVRSENFTASVFPISSEISLLGFTNLIIEVERNQQSQISNASFFPISSDFSLLGFPNFIN